MSTVSDTDKNLTRVIDLPIEQLLPRLRRLLHRDWDTDAGTAARRLLWSLYNQQSPPAQLWAEVMELEPGHIAELCKLLQSSPDIRAARLTALLTITGELERIDRVPLYPEPFRPIFDINGRPWRDYREYLARHTDQPEDAA